MARIGLAVAGLGAAAVLTACGGSDSSFADESADDIVKAAKVRHELTLTSGEGLRRHPRWPADQPRPTRPDGSCTGTIRPRRRHTASSASTGRRG